MNEERDVVTLKRTPRVSVTPNFLKANLVNRMDITPDLMISESAGPHCTLGLKGIGRAYSIVLEGGPYSGRTFILAAHTTLGRVQQNDVVLNDPGVSRNHAVIVQSGQCYYLRDLASTNGTFVNQRNISTEDYSLETGDRIRLGRSDITSLIFQAPTHRSLQMSIQDIVSGTKDETPPVLSRPLAKSVDKKTECYEGRFVLHLKSEAYIGLLLDYIRALRANPHFEFFRFLTDPSLGVDVWLGLREPLPLPQVLMEMENVANVFPDSSNGGAYDDDGPGFTVALVEQST